MKYRNDYKKPFSTGKAILKAAKKEEAIRAKIRELESQASEAYPSWLK
jgi:hypothetical protein